MILYCDSCNTNAILVMLQVLYTSNDINYQVNIDIVPFCCPYFLLNLEMVK